MVEAPWDVNVAFTDQKPDAQVLPQRARKAAKPRATLAAFGKTHLYFGGLDIDPRANREQSLNTANAYALEVVDPVTGKRTPIETPKNAAIASPIWSPDRAHLAYIASFDDVSHIYVADPGTGKSTQVTTTPLNATLVTTLKWTADSRHIATVLIPDNRRPAPTRAKAGHRATHTAVDG